MTRKFPNFLEAYLEYADNGFSPRVFHKWSCLSIVAAALERKVWLPFRSRSNYLYPNLYVLLVGSPGVGKSSAGDLATGLIHELNERYPESVNFIPSKITEAAFIDAMSITKALLKEGTPDGIIRYHSSGYLYAPEASNSLYDLYGSFIACITDFYDCHKFWQKETKKDGKKVLRNICFNLLSATTFDFLGKLLQGSNIDGGFASRLTYIRALNHKAKRGEFDGGLDAVDERPERLIYRQDLINDLHLINLMQGPYRVEPGYGKLFEQFERDYDEAMAKAPSDKLRAILVRKPTILQKLSMVVAATQSQELLLRENHFHEALQLVQEAEDGLPQMLRDAAAHATDTPVGMNNAIAGVLSQSHYTLAEFKRELLRRGFDPARAEQTVQSYMNAQMITVDQAGKIKLLVDPDSLL